MEPESKRDENNGLDTPLPLWLLMMMPLYASAVMAVFLFPVAGDWRWFEAWLYIFTFALNITISYSIINKKNPRVLRNRMKLKKVGLTTATQKAAGSDRFVMPIMSFGFFCALIVPGLGHRLGWPSIPLVVEMTGLVLMNTGLIIMNIAILQNSYASKLLDINQNQRLVDTGLYAHVRHPLYAGALLMALTIPISLGSWWGLIPASVAALMVIVRIPFEEEMLLKGMEDYQAYQTRVKYKLIPKIY